MPRTRTVPPSPPLPLPLPLPPVLGLLLPLGLVLVLVTPPMVSLARTVARCQHPGNRPGSSPAPSGPRSRSATDTANTPPDATNPSTAATSTTPPPTATAAPPPSPKADSSAPPTTESPHYETLARSKLLRKGPFQGRTELSGARTGNALGRFRSRRTPSNDLSMIRNFGHAGLDLSVGNDRHLHVSPKVTEFRCE